MTHAVGREVAQAAQAAVAAKPLRAVTTFSIPAALQSPYASIGLVELETGEELMAARRAGSEPMALAYELTKQSIYEVTDAGTSAPRQVTLADASTDEVWRRSGPKLRQLLMQAYSLLHTPGNDVEQDFLKSRRTSI